MNESHSNEMRGSLWSESDRKSDKSPTATGILTVSGVELRLALWPKRKAGGNGPRAGQEYWPVSVEYRQGTKFFLAKVSPANVLATGATAAAEPAPAATPAAAAPADPDDMPF